MSRTNAEVSELGSREKMAGMERALRKFMDVTETRDDGITQMATIEGRVKFYERLRIVRAEAHNALIHKTKQQLTGNVKQP